MKIILDTDACKNRGEDGAVALYLVSLLSGCKITQNTFEQARKRGLLKFEQMYDPRNPFPEYVSLTQTGEYVIEGLMASSNGDKADDEYLELADKLREIYPSGVKPGYKYTWRDSSSCIADRLKKFFLKYKSVFDKKGIDYSNDAIINATKEYVGSFNGDYQYMQLLKYFIWKNKVTGEEVVRGRIVGEVEKQSQLAAWLEDKKENKQISKDWEARLC